jgi:hypothetical protein
VELLERLRRQALGSRVAVDDPRRGVCPDCIADAALARFVARNAGIERCAFCGDPGPNGLALDALLTYITRCLAGEWDDPARDVSGDGDGDGLFGDLGSLDSGELLAALGEPLANAGVRAAFVEAFDHRWCRRDRFGLSADDRLRLSWDAFATYLKERSRFLFLRTGRGIGSGRGAHGLIDPAEMLDEVQVAIANSGLVRRLDTGAQLFRARDHDPAKAPATAAELGPPPASAPANRMSPAGISMFYAAEDPDTALAELRPKSWPRAATVGTWVTARELRYLELAEVTIPSTFDMTARGRRTWLAFLQPFAAEVAKPVQAGAGEVDYVPTQVFTEYVRDVLLDADGEPLQGIRYRSAARPGGVSWVLFVGPSGCCELGPGWDDPRTWMGLDTGPLLGLDTGSLRRFRPWWREAGP